MLSKRLSWARKPYLGLVYVPSRPRHFARSCPRPVCMRYNCALGAAPPRATRVTLGASESPFFSTYGNFNTARATGEVHACRKESHAANSFIPVPHTVLCSGHCVDSRGCVFVREAQCAKLPYTLGSVHTVHLAQESHPFQRSKTDTSNIGLHLVLVGCDSSSA